MKKIYKVKIDFIDTRLDRWFRKNVCDVPQSLIEKNIRKGNIKVNNKKVKSSYKLQKEDLIILYDILFSSQNRNKSKNFYKANKKDLSHSSKMFIENNENFVVINKPAGIAVQSGTKSKRNILDILKKRLLHYSKYCWLLYCERSCLDSKTCKRSIGNKFC